MLAATSVLSTIKPLLDDHKFSLALRIAESLAKSYDLDVPDIRRDFQRIKQLGFELHEWEQASQLLVNVSVRLEKMLESGVRG